LIPLVFPLKIKGERYKYMYEIGLLPPLFIREGRGGIGFNAILSNIDTPSHSLKIKGERYKYIYEIGLLPPLLVREG